MSLERLPNNSELDPHQFESLFTDLGQQILSLDSRKPIDCVISDDTSGRLLAYFSYKLLKSKHDVSFLGVHGGSYNSEDMFEYIDDKQRFSYEDSILKRLENAQRDIRNPAAHFLIATEIIDTGITIASINLLLKKVYPNCNITVVTQEEIPGRQLYKPRDNNIEIIKPLTGSKIKDIHLLSSLERRSRLAERFVITVETHEQKRQKSLAARRMIDDIIRKMNI